jgi:hypothetical protein
MDSGVSVFCVNRQITDRPRFIALFAKISESCGLIFVAMSPSRQPSQLPVSGHAQTRPQPSCPATPVPWSARQAQMSSSRTLSLFTVSPGSAGQGTPHSYTEAYILPVRETFLAINASYCCLASVEYFCSKTRACAVMRSVLGTSVRQSGTSKLVHRSSQTPTASDRRD